MKAHQHCSIDQKILLISLTILRREVQVGRDPCVANSFYHRTSFDKSFIAIIPKKFLRTSTYREERDSTHD